MHKNNLHHKKQNYLQSVVKNQQSLTPLDSIRINLLSAVKSDRRTPIGNTNHWTYTLRWAIGFGMAVFVFAVLWVIVKPGVILGWTVQGYQPVLYRVYKEVSSNEKRELIHEVNGLPGEESYKFVDLFTFPAVNYTYTVDGLSTNGHVITSQTTVVDTTSILPNQIAIILVSLIFGVCAVIFSKNISLPYAVMQTW